MTATLSAPPWIAHDGSYVCPVPAGHDVEFKQHIMTSTSLRGSNPEKLSWKVITHYRDWTAFAQASKPPFIDTEGLERLDAAFQQEAQASEPVVDVPEWAKQRAAELIANDHTFIAFARYIAAHEPVSVDPLRKVVEEVWNTALELQKADSTLDGIGALAQALRASIPKLSRLQAQDKYCTADGCYRNVGKKENVAQSAATNRNIMNTELVNEIRDALEDFESSASDIWVSIRSTRLLNKIKEEYD